MRAYVYSFWNVGLYLEALKLQWKEEASVLCLLPSLLSSCLRFLSPNSHALILVSVLLRCRPVSHCHVCINMWSPRVHRLESSFFQRVTCVTSASPVVLWYGRNEKGGPRLLYQFINSWLLGKEHQMRRKKREIIPVLDIFSKSLGPYSLRKGRNIWSPKLWYSAFLVHRSETHIHTISVPNISRQGPSSSS